MSSRHVPAVQGPLLLDTHVWFWLANGDERLGAAGRARIDEAARRGRLRVSAISVWELALLEIKGRIRLGMDCLAWVEAALAAPGLRLTPLSPRIAVASTRLPGEFHGDPADRILVATARATRATLLSRDARILEYGKAGYVSTLPA